jgi:hypothetical protein
MCLVGNGFGGIPPKPYRAYEIRKAKENFAGMNLSEAQSRKALSEGG